MNKPAIKREVAVFSYSKDFHTIHIVSTLDALEDFKSLGNILPMHHKENNDRYSIFVDPRYDFDEVLAYIQGYSE